MCTEFDYLFPIQEGDVLGSAQVIFTYIFRNSAKLFGHYLRSSCISLEYSVQAKMEQLCLLHPRYPS